MTFVFALTTLIPVVAADIPGEKGNEDSGEVGECDNGVFSSEDEMCVDGRWWFKGLGIGTP